MFSFRYFIPTILAGVLGITIAASMVSGNVITGKMKTEGKITVIGDKAIQQEHTDGTVEYTTDISNRPAFQKTLEASMRDGRSVAIFWSCKKDKMTGHQENTIDHIQ